MQLVYSKTKVIQEIWLAYITMQFCQKYSQQVVQQDKLNNALITLYSFRQIYSIPAKNITPNDAVS